MMQVGIVIISDRGSRGEYEDRSGPVMVEMLGEHSDWQVDRRTIIPDEFDQIVTTLTEWSSDGLNLILTSGGTGFSPRDITPEATRRVIEREAPGLVEAVRAESFKITRHAMLSRAVAGIRGRTLIINMPGNPKAVRENLDILLPILPHALALLADSPDTESQHRTV